MSAAALDQLRQGGFTLSLVPGSADRLLIKPLSKVTSEVRELIGSNRAAIVASLTAEAANDGPPPAPAPALPPAPPAPAPDPDRACWPHSVAMNRAEIDRMVQRLALFEAQGLPLDEAEAEADRLMRLERTRSSPAPLSAVPPPATPPAPAKRTYALPDRELDRASQRHHFTCPVCIAAGKRGGTRCAVGLTLNMVATGQTCHPHVGTGGGIP